MLTATVLAQDNETVGRYQLFGGTYEFTVKGVPVETHAVFRIDTQTGTTSVYRVGSDKDGKFDEYWSGINELPEAVRKAMARPKATPEKP